MIELPTVAVGFTLGLAIVAFIVWLAGVLHGLKVDHAGEWVGFECHVCGFPTIIHRTEWDGSRRCVAHRPVNASLAARSARRASIHQNVIRGREKGTQR